MRLLKGLQTPNPKPETLNPQQAAIRLLLDMPAAWADPSPSHFSLAMWACGDWELRGLGFRV